MRRGVVLGAAAVLLSACGAGDDDSSATIHVPGDVGSAPYGPGREAVCDLLPDDTPTVTEAVAQRDNKVLADRLMSADDGVRSISVAECGTKYVVQVGVASSAVKVPGRGPGGTPVVTHRQRAVYAF